MKVLVAVKRVVDYKAIIRVKADATGIETLNVKMAINPFDEIAVEEAIRLKEKGIASEVMAVSIGNDACQETLRSALAMGADSALLIKTDDLIEPLAAAKILKYLVQQQAVQLVILGKQAIDTDHNQVAQMLAGLLNWPQGTFASALQLEEHGLRVTREIDGGLEVLFLALPAVISTDLRLNEPRYLSLPNIVKAKQKPLSVIAAASLGLDLAPRLQQQSVQPPKKRAKGRILSNAKELVACLKNEARVIA